MKKSKQNKLRKKRLAKDMTRNSLQICVDACEGFFLDIFDAVGLWRFVDWYLKKQEAMRYLVFGALSTIVNIVVFVIFDFFGLPVLASNTIAWIAAVVFAYITNRFCVFNSKADNILKEIISFAGARVATLIIEDILIFITVEKLGWNSILMKVISNIIVIILNYFFSKLFIFKKEPAETESEKA